MQMIFPIVFVGKAGTVIFADNRGLNFKGEQKIKYRSRRKPEQW